MLPAETLPPFEGSASTWLVFVLVLVLIGKHVTVTVTNGLGAADYPCWPTKVQPFAQAG